MTRNDYLSAVSDPLLFAEPEDASWDDEADLVVVGFGGAGASAALQARELGGYVIALDRFGGGGATAFSGGVFYAGGTRFQAEAGFDDDADNMFAYLSQEEAAVRLDTLRRFCENSNDDLEWLAGYGVPFDGKAYPEKTAYPPDGYYLYYSGNEKVPSYMQKARPAPRGHRTVGKGYSGYAYFDALKAAALNSGVRLQQHSPVLRLVMDRAGTVIGVETRLIPQDRCPEHEALYRKVNPMRPFAGARHEKAVADTAKFEAQFATRRLIRARRGVVLSTGGFVYNLPMIKKHRPIFARTYKAITRIGSMGCDGSGIDLGRSVGGATQLMDEIFAARSIVPPAGLLHGILVDAKGRRFVNEDAYAGFVGERIAKLPEDGKAWLILDRSCFREAVKECLFPGKGLYIYTLPSLLNIVFGGTRRARSLDRLAKKCGLDPAELSESVAQNNAVARGERDDPLGKSPDNARPLERPSYYAINMDLGNRFASTLVFTLGGLVVDETSSAVLRDDGAAVPGLFAAGRTAVGLCSKGYLSGMSLSDTVFSGRRAARSVMSDRPG